MTSGFSGSPAEHTTRRSGSGYSVPASAMAVIARSAVGVVNMFWTPWRARKSSCSFGSKPPLRANTRATAP